MISDYVNLVIECQLEVRTDIVIAYSNDGVWTTAHYSGPIRWKIDQITSTTIEADGGVIAWMNQKTLFRVIRSSNASAPKMMDTRWNGTCVICKRGTYTGFTSVEHEGGSCVT